VSPQERGRAFHPASKSEIVMSDIVQEIREAYAAVGIALDQPAAYGTYYRLRCAGCERMIGNVGDRLLPGMARELVDAHFELYAAGLLGCGCGHQRERTRALDPARWQAGRERYARLDPPVGRGPSATS
jgi:hypothetical protein